MSGLREKQKQARREAISQAAIELIKRQGYQNTTIEQIAQEAGVSAPTVFAYFGSKQEILLEMLAGADERAFSDARANLDAFSDPVDALCDLEQRLVRYAMDLLSPALWRELLPLVLINGGDGLPDSYRRMNDAVRAQIAGLISVLQERGMLRADLDVELSAFLLNDYSHLQLLRLTAQDEPDYSAHAAQVRRITGLIVDGMRS